MRRLISYLFCAVSTLQVISDPYRGVNYDRVNVYEIETVYLEDCIHVTLGDGFSESGIDNDQEEYAGLEEVEEVEEVPYYLKPPSPWWK